MDRLLFRSRGGVEGLPLEANDRVLGRPQPLAAASPDRGEGEGGGEGGGGSVAEFSIVQSLFEDSACPFPRGCQGPCDVVLVLWTEVEPNPEGVRVSLDGQELGVVAGLPADSLPAENGIRLIFVPPGERTFRAEAVHDGSGAEGMLQVLDEQPFGDASALRCEPGAVAGDGTCQLVTSWTNSAPFPELYSVFLDDQPIGAVSGTSLGLSIDGVASGNHCLQVVGFLAAGESAAYRGCVVQTCCEIACEALPCAPVTRLLLCQTAYGAGDADNAVRVSWQNAVESYAEGIHLFVDGVEAGRIPGESQQASLGALAPGDRRIAVQGDCGGANGTSPLVDAEIRLLDASPHAAPVTPEGLRCSFVPDPDGPGPELSFTRADWVNGDPSVFIDVYLENAQGRQYAGTLDGTSTSVGINGTSPEDRVQLQFFTTIGGVCYGSPLVGCGSQGPRFLAGLCDGAGSRVQISSVVFGLNRLFGGGPAPGCWQACDADGNGTVALTDMVYLLGFLFRGGPAPAVWQDENGDGVPDATCVRASAEDDCQEGHEFCDFE